MRYFLIYLDISCYDNLCIPNVIFDHFTCSEPLLLRLHHVISGPGDGICSSETSSTKYFSRMLKVRTGRKEEIEGGW